MDHRDTVIAVYEKILSGEQKSFSPYFFQPQHRKEKLTYLVQYLIEEKLGLTPERALQEIALADLEKYKLDCILKYIDKPVEYLDDDVRHIVYFAYPQLPKPSEEELTIQVYEDVRNGRRKTFPKNYFVSGVASERRAVVCFRHLCEKVLKLDDASILQTFSTSDGIKVLADQRLKIIMQVCFNSLVDLLETAYPGRFKY